MTRISFLCTWVFALASFTAVPALAPSWSVSVVIPGTTIVCDNAQIELVLATRDGAELERTVLDLPRGDDRSSETTWEIDHLPNGAYAVDALIMGCDSQIKSTVRVNTLVSARDLRKTILIVISQGAQFRIEYMEVTTRLDGSGIFQASWSEDETPEITYLGVETISHCKLGHSHIRFEWEFLGEWGNSSDATWDENHPTLSTGDRLIPSPGFISVKTWRPNCLWTKPDGKRLSVAIAPPDGNYFIAEDPIRMALIQGCDTYTLQLPVTDHDPKFCAPEGQEFEPPLLEPIIGASEPK